MICSAATLFQSILAKMFYSINNVDRFGCFFIYPGIKYSLVTLLLWQPSTPQAEGIKAGVRKQSKQWRKSVVPLGTAVWKQHTEDTTTRPPLPHLPQCLETVRWASPGRAGPTFAGTSLFWGRTGRGWARRSLAWRTDGGWWRLWNPTPAPSCKQRPSGNINTQDQTRRTAVLQLLH